MQKRTILAKRLFLLWISAATTVAIQPLSVFASGSPDVVGILATITDPSKAAELGLSQDQIDRIEALIKQHESQSLEFASQLRSLPTAERRLKESENIRRVERMGMALLNEEQQAKAESWRLQKIGLPALADPEVAGRLGISDEQIGKVKNILEGRSRLAVEVGRTKATEEISKRIDEILTDEQRSKWQSMAAVAKPSASGATNESANATGQASPSDAPANPTAVAVAGASDGFLLNFNATPWKDVLQWLAKEAELSLQVDSFPTGSFSYRDPYRRYTLTEAMDIMNGILLGKGYTLLKNQRVLASIDLGSGESAEVIRAYLRDRAELVLEQDLDKRGDYEVIKCIFPLKNATIEEIEKELKLLISPHGSILSIPSANQVLITDTGGKLRIIRETIKRSEDPKGIRSGRILHMPLQYISAEEVFSIARPLLGLKDGVNTSDDLNLASNTFGDTIYATGAADKLQKLAALAKEMDVKPAESASQATPTDPPEIKSHPLLGSDPTTTMDVLQTQFSGQTNIRMTMDPKTSNIIALASKADHAKIENTISVLAGQASDFTVIPLRSMEVAAALLALEKVFGKPAKDATTAKGPIFFGDTASKSIMVKGTKQEIDQVRQLLTTVEASNPMTKGIDDGMIMLPLKGKAADRWLEQIELLRSATKRKNPIRVVIPESAKKPSEQEAKKPTDSKTLSQSDSTKSSSWIQFAVARPEEEKPVATQVEFVESTVETPDEPSTAQKTKPDDEIIIYRGPTGMIITSESREALKEFDQIAKMVGEGSGSSEPSVIYLKYIRAAAAKELIEGIIRGEISSSAGGGSSLLGDVASSVLGGGGLFGGLFGGGGGGGSSASTGPVTGPGATGEVTIIPDPRLNVLWVQANPIDLQKIEDLIELIDVADSQVESKTRGTPQTIYVKNIAVADVEAVVKEVFADRIGQSGQAGGAQAANQQQQLLQMLAGGAGGGRGGRGAFGGGRQQSELKEMTMTISSDKKNNALIVVGPPNLFKEVEALVKQMDEDAGEEDQSIVVIPVGGEMSPNIMKAAVESVFPSAKTSTTSNGQTNNNNRNTNNANPNDFFQQFRNRGGTGGFQGGGFQFPGGGGFQGGGNRGGGFQGGGFQGGGNRGGGFGNQGGGNRGGFGNQGGGGNRGGFGNQGGGGNRGRN